MRVIGLDGGGDIFCADRPVWLHGQNLVNRAAEHRGPARFVTKDVIGVTDDDFVTAPAMGQDAGEIALCAGRQIQTRFLAHQASGNLLQPDNCGIFPIDIITDNSFGHRGAHGVRGPGDSI